MSVGIEKMDLYAGRLQADAVGIAEASGKPRAYAEGQLMLGARTVLPPFEDPVTLAVNAAERLLRGEDRSTIELLVVATESALDFGKPLSTWVHRHLGLPPSCRSFEIKHACYSGTAAFKVAAAAVPTLLAPGNKALVICSDITRPSVRPGDSWDFIGGACAVAFLVSAEPRLLEIDPRRAGFWTHEIADVFRPTARDEVGDDITSVYSYLDALEGSWLHFRERAGAIDFTSWFGRHVYHAPFPGMTLQAHRTMLDLVDLGRAAASAAEVAESFDQRVRPGLRLARRIGTQYGASTFVGLLSWLSDPRRLVAPGDRLSVFSYGSGCQGELYEARIGEGALEAALASGIDAHLDEREPLDLPAFLEAERARAAGIEAADLTPDRGALAGAFARKYAGRGLLVLEAVRGHVRSYARS